MARPCNSHHSTILFGVRHSVHKIALGVRICPVFGHLVAKFCGAAQQFTVDLSCAVHHRTFANDGRGGFKGEDFYMVEQFQKFGEEFNRAGKAGFEAAIRSFGDVNAGLQAIAVKVTDYQKKAFEDGTRTFEQLISAKSVEQAIEIQSQFAKKAFDAYIAEMSKIGEMYVAITRNAYKPLAQTVAKKAQEVVSKV